jgi:hypothetical protein
MAMHNPPIPASSLLRCIWSQEFERRELAGDKPYRLVAPHSDEALSWIGKSILRLLYDNIVGHSLARMRFEIVSPLRQSKTFEHDENEPKSGIEAAQF